MRQPTLNIIPAQAGIHKLRTKQVRVAVATTSESLEIMDSRLRGNDEDYLESKLSPPRGKLRVGQEFFSIKCRHDGLA